MAGSNRKWYAKAHLKFMKRGCEQDINDQIQIKSVVGKSNMGIGFPSHDIKMYKRTHSEISDNQLRINFIMFTTSEVNLLNVEDNNTCNFNYQAFK